jgi:hypothetical protein
MSFFYWTTSRLPEIDQGYSIVNIQLISCSTESSNLLIANLACIWKKMEKYTDTQKVTKIFRITNVHSFTYTGRVVVNN